MKLSIVIPFFNSEKYLRECLDSIFRNKVRNFAKNVEIILVDNNSADGSRKIAREFVKKFPHTIKLFTCKTKGASAARNVGIKKARGEYIWCVDSDDWISDDAIAAIFAAVKTRPDVVNIGMKMIWPDGRERWLPAVDTRKKNWRKTFVRYGFGVVQLISRREWLIANDLFFDEGIMHEDMALLSSFVLFAKKVNFVEKPIYFYRQHMESVINKSDWSPSFFDIFPALEKLYARFEKENAVAKFHDELEHFFIWNLLSDSARDFGNFREGKSGFKKSRALLKKYFPRWRTNKYLRAKSRRVILRTQLAYFGIVRERFKKEKMRR